MRRFAGRLTVEASRLAHITSEVIELSRLQARDALRPDVLVPIDEVVAARSTRTGSSRPAKHVDIAVRASTKAEVYGDRALLVVAVHNLVSNAIAYSNEGGRGGRGREGRRRHRRDRDHRPGHRHRGRRPRAHLRALLPGRPGPLAQHRRVGPRAQHRQAHGAEPRRRRAGVVAAGPGIDLHDPPPRRRGGPRGPPTTARASAHPARPCRRPPPGRAGAARGARARTAEPATRVATPHRGEPT